MLSGALYPPVEEEGSGKGWSGEGGSKEESVVRGRNVVRTGKGEEDSETKG